MCSEPHFSTAETNRTEVYDPVVAPSIDTYPPFLTCKMCLKFRWVRHSHPQQIPNGALARG